MTNGLNGRQPLRAPLRNSPTDALTQALRESRARRETGLLLPPGPGPGRSSGQLRLFFCRACGARKHSVRVPQGWYTLVRHTGDGILKLGAYCCAACLEKQLPRLIGIEKDLATDSPDATPASA